MTLIVAGCGFESPKAACRIGNRETRTHRRSRKHSHFIQFVSFSLASPPSLHLLTHLQESYAKASPLLGVTTNSHWKVRCKTCPHVDLFPTRLNMDSVRVVTIPRDYLRFSQANDLNHISSCSGSVPLDSSPAPLVPSDYSTFLSSSSSSRLPFSGPLQPISPIDPRNALAKGLSDLRMDHLSSCKPSNA